MKNKKQIIFIHGGYTFGKQGDYIQFLKNYNIDPYKKKFYWINWAKEKLGKNWEVLHPDMPCKQNAKYEEWKIWFEKYLKFIKDKKLIIIGHSLGAIFLIKYFVENKFPKKVYQLHLISPAVVDEGLGPEKLATFKVDIKKIKNIKDKCEELHLWHSKDDNICLFKNSEIIKKEIPESDFHIFKNRGHFKQKSFPEIIKIIKKVK